MPFSFGSEVGTEGGFETGMGIGELLRDVMSYQSDDQTCYRLASALGNLANDLILDRQFAEAQARCEESLNQVNSIGKGVQMSRCTKLGDWRSLGRSETRTTAKPDKWVVNASILASMTGGYRPAINTFIEARKQKIDELNAAHGLGPGHNRITDIL